MAPDGDNVYGIITAPAGMQVVLNAIHDLAVGGRCYIYRSGFDGSETLHLQSDAVEFESTPLGENNEHLFNGGVDGTLEEVELFVQSLSDALQIRGIKHRFEFYDEDGKLVRYIPA